MHKGLIHLLILSNAYRQAFFLLFLTAIDTP